MSCSCFFEKLDEKTRPKSRVELHLHLDGAVRPTTIWELSRKKGVDLGFDCLEELKDAIRIKRPGTLDDYLKSFNIILPVFIGDGEALERAAYELCEDQAKQGVLYFETRYSPQMCSSTHSPITIQQGLNSEDEEAFTPRNVVQALTRGLKKGQEDFSIKCRSILCCIRGKPEWNEDVLDLCVEFANQGVVGMDIAGNEDFSQEDFAVFKRAASLGVHRTAHAGQAGPGSNVALVIEEMQVERVGHGYRVVQDEEAYSMVLSKGIHLEACPHSSLLTGAVPLSTPKHSIVRFAEDGANFSINKDDPTITGTTLDDEYELLRKMGLDQSHFAKANFNAARSSFLPENEKQELLDKLCCIYGAKP